MQARARACVLIPSRINSTWTLNRLSHIIPMFSIILRYVVLDIPRVIFSLPSEIIVSMYECRGICSLCDTIVKEKIIDVVKAEKNI